MKRKKEGRERKREIRAANSGPRAVHAHTLDQFYKHIVYQYMHIEIYTMIKGGGANCCVIQSDNVLQSILRFITYVKYNFISTFMYIMYLCVLYVLYMSSWVSIKMSHVYICLFLIQSKFEAYSSQIFFQSFFVESKFLKFCIVTQIGASFDHFPYFSDLTEYRFRFVLVSYEIKHVSHDGRNSCHLELLVAHCD